MKKDIILLGYSGHAYVVIDAFQSSGLSVSSYFSNNKNTDNPYKLDYLGTENREIISKNIDHEFFVAIGDNKIRLDRLKFLENAGVEVATAIHKTSIIGNHTEIGAGTLVAAGAIINPGVKIGKGCIINTGAIIEHECQIDDFTHVAPGAVLAGSVQVEQQSFIGANSVIKEGIHIGSNAVVGAGSVVLTNLEKEKTYFGNPAKLKL